MELMNSDLYKTLKRQRLTDEQVTFHIYQILRALKVHVYIYECVVTTNSSFCLSVVYFSLSMSIQLESYTE